MILLRIVSCVNRIYANLRKSVLLNHMNFQIVKINGLNKIILCEPCFVVPFKFRDGGIQPNGLSQIKLIANVVQSLKNLMGAGILTVIADNGYP